MYKLYLPRVEHLYIDQQLSDIEAELNRRRRAVARAERAIAGAVKAILSAPLAPETITALRNILMPIYRERAVEKVRAERATKRLEP